MTVRKTHTTQFKAKVALEAIREQKTVNELTAEYGVHATQINTWKKQILTAIPAVFSRKNNKAEQEQQGLMDELYRQIGQLTVERDWLKKNAGLPHRR
jgi:transposase